MAEHPTQRFLRLNDSGLVFSILFQEGKDLGKGIVEADGKKGHFRISQPAVG